MLIIGLMSGTSADGVDAALVDIHGGGPRISAELVAFVTDPFEQKVRHAVLRLCNPHTGRIPELCALNEILGRRFAESACRVAASAGIPLTDITAIASHGQTVWHQPNALALNGTMGRGTLQIGSAPVIAAETGRTVISDFRGADMAAGGQGAPLVPFADWALLRSRREARAIQNIGGIANVTYLPRAARPADVLAFDTGPGNMIIDSVVRELSGGDRQMDRDGGWAALGNPDSRLLQQLLRHSYFGERPPKTTGREVFGEPYARAILRKARKYGMSDADIVATVTALTAESIAEAYRSWILPRGSVETVVLGGGGARNRTLVKLLEDRLRPSRVTNHEELGIPGDAKEAIAFAILGYETLHRRPSNIPTATGAAYSAVLGSITPPPR